MDLILGLEYAVRMNRRLTSDQAQAIIDRVAEGESQKKLATEFGVQPSTISSLVSGRTWPDLDRPDPPEVRIRGSKLSAKDIPIILARLAGRELPKNIAVHYGVTRQAIADIKRGKTWHHIPRPEPARPRRQKVWEKL